MCVVGSRAHPGNDATTDAAPRSPAPTGDERGSLVADVLLGQVDQAVTNLGATAHRITYRSTSGVDAGGVDVTGTVFVPAGAPPEGDGRSCPSGTARRV